MIEFRLPPSRPDANAGTRALVPFVPRPAVLPFEPSPRPTRVRSFLAPAAGRRWCILRTVAPLLSEHPSRASWMPWSPSAAAGRLLGAAAALSLSAAVAFGAVVALVAGFAAAGALAAAGFFSAAGFCSSLLQACFAAGSAPSLQRRASSPLPVPWPQPLVNLLDLDQVSDGSERTRGSAGCPRGRRSRRSSSARGCGGCRAGSASPLIFDLIWVTLSRPAIRHLPSAAAAASACALSRRAGTTWSMREPATCCHGARLLELLRAPRRSRARC